MNVTILCGGFSSEREISLRTGTAVYKALSRVKNYSVKLIDLKQASYIQQILSLKKQPVDIVFIALHGKFGEDGKLQALLEMLDIKYTGSGVIPSAIAMNKHWTKYLLRNSNIPTLDWVVIKKTDKNKLSTIINNFSYPLIIKPCNEGSTIGVSIVNSFSELKSGLDLAFNYDEYVIIEKFISGKEITAPILGDKVLPLIEIKPNLNKYYDYSSKYLPSGSTHIIPPRIDKKLYSYIEELALKSIKCIGCEIVARVDFIVDEKGNPYVLEINTIPGMTETSLLPESAKKVGLSFENLVEKIIQLSLKKYK